MAGLLAYAAAGALQGAGEGIAANAVARRQAALEELREQRRQAERQEDRSWQIEDRDFSAAQSVKMAGMRGGGGGSGGGATATQRDYNFWIDQYLEENGLSREDGIPSEARDFANKMIRPSLNREPGDDNLSTAQRTSYINDFITKNGPGTSSYRRLTQENNGVPPTEDELLDLAYQYVERISVVPKLEQATPADTATDAEQDTGAQQVTPQDILTMTEDDFAAFLNGFDPSAASMEVLQAIEDRMTP